MPPQNFQRKRIPFTQRGFSLARPVEMLPPDLLALCVNARYYTAPGGGEWRQRPGTSAYGGMAAMDQLTTHSARRLNNPAPGATFAYWHGLGAGTKFYVENAAHNAFASLITGLSGNPLSLITERPYQSPYPWMYLADANLWRKVGEVSGALTAYGWGVAPPLNPPSLALGSPVYKVISDFDALTESAVAWAQGGVAAAPAIATRLNQLITYIKFDSGSTGWCSIVPDAFPVDLQPGMRLAINTGGGTAESVRVEEVFEQIASTTIQSITFDTAAPGACAIQPVVPVKGIRRDMLLRLNTGGGTAENVRVTDVTEGPDGITSFRCVTANNHAAAETIDGLRSFRTLTANTHAVAETLTASCMSSAMGGSGTGTLTHAVARDLSLTSSSGLPLSEKDWLHISILLSDPSLLQEGRLLLDLNPTGSTHNFDENALFAVFRASDLQPAITGGQTLITAQRTQLARQLLEQRAARIESYQTMRSREYGYQGYEGFFPDLPYDPELDYTPEDPLDASGDSTQAPTGASQWYELKVRLGDLQRIGSDQSRTLKDVASIRVSVTVTGACTLKVDSFWVGGGYGLDSAPDDFSTLPYYYAYRYRSSVTGAKSNFSPPTRAGVMPRRNSVVVTTSASSDAQVDLVDIVRAGGALSDWRIIATIADGSSFTDTLPDSALLGAKSFQLAADFQPFPSVDLPRSGTCNVSGTTVTWVSGDTFNTSWSRNSKIIIDGVEYSLYTSPSSTTKLELNQSAGTKSGATFHLDGATLLGQPLPCAWGPAGGGMFGPVIFACGDSRQAGHLFYTTPGDPDSCSDTGSLEITSASEPLQNGCTYRGRSLVFSTEGCYEILPRFGYGYQVIENVGSPFLAERLQGVKGLYARWALCTGDLVYFLARDGLYATNGAEVKCLTDEVRQLFPHDGLPGNSVVRYGTTIYPPDMTQTSALRLAWHSGRLYFTYIDTNSQRRTLVINTEAGAPESIDSYPQGVTFNYSEEGSGVYSFLLGGADGKLYVNTGATDPGPTAISSLVGTGFENLGDSRLVKLFGDIYVEAQGNNSDQLTVTPYFDEEEGVLGSTLLTPSGRSESVIDFNSGAGRLGRSIGLKLAISGSGAAVKLLAWEPSFLPKLEESFLRATDWDDCGWAGDKYLRGVVIECDTSGVDRTVQIQKDGAAAALGAPLALNHNGQVRKVYPLSPPFVSHLVRLLPTDSDPWRGPFEVEWIYDRYPELASIYSSIEQLGKESAKYFRGVNLEVDTNNSPVDVGVWADGVLVHTFTALTANGKRTLPLTFTTPFYAYEVQLIPSAPIRFFDGTVWVFDPAPDSTTRFTEWTDGGHAGRKFLQGVVLRADTGGANVSVEVLGDEGALLDTLTVNHNGDAEKSYSLTAPVRTNLMRLAPQSALRLSSVRWVYEPEPDTGRVWRTQPTANGSGLYQLLGPQLSLMHLSTVDFTVEIYADGVLKHTEVVDNSGGEVARTDLMLPSIKGRLFEWRFGGAAPFALYREGCVAYLKDWGSEGPYRPMHIFGGPSFSKGAEI